MKLFLSIAFLSILLSSCNDNKPEYDVTVIGKDASIAAKFAKFMDRKDSYLAITLSGDTIPVRIREELILNNKLPFKAIMKKASDEETGFISKIKK